jgi:methylamine--corrinoid protein Co-methyltransferase
MISLLEIARRSQEGPKVTDRDWEMGLFQKMKALAEKYQIRYPADGSWFNHDPSLVDRAFEAALEFLIDRGIFCVSTGRIIQLTEAEIRTALREAPRQILMGEGRDQRVFRQQKIEGPGPLNFCPGHHSPFTEELAPLVVQNFAQIPRTDFLEGFNFSSVGGYEIVGTPMEAYASRRQLAWMREGIAQAGRPGLAIVYYPLNTRPAAMLAGLDPIHGLRPTDGILISALPDVKVESDMLAAALVYEEYGAFKISGSFAIAGGFCGGLEGAVIEGIVKPVAAMIVYRVSLQYTGVEHTSNLSSLKITLQPYNWARSLVNQVLNTKTPIICMAWVIPTSGPGTETNLLETAIRSIEAPINGANLYAPRHSRARMNAGQTPLEAQWALEVSDATIRAGWNREKAGEVLWRIAERLKDRPPEEGFPIQECYDLVNHRPRPAYQDLYGRVKEELSRLGLPLKDGP